MKQKIHHMTEAAMIAALYVLLTYLSSALGLASGAVQLRLSEALCILPFFIPSTSVGLFIGCIISNLTMASAPLDIVFGSLATLIGAYIGSKMKSKWLVPIPTVISNTVIVPIVILVCYTARDTWSLGTYAITALGVFAGEVLSAYVLGMVLLLALQRRGLLNSNGEK